MSFAQNFKKALNNTDIFNPVENTSGKNIIARGSSGSSIPSIAPEMIKYKFSDLVTDVVKKIKRTPYWKEYSEEEQEKMVSRYFDAKVKQSKYSQIKFNLKDKLDFIENVFARIK